VKRLLIADSLVVIVAALNEEQGIGPSLAELKTVLGDPKLLVIDGNSTDKTVKIAKEMGADVLIQDRQGKGQAISQAIGHINSNIKYVVFIDADYTYPAEYIPEMIQILEENHKVGMVSGNRFTNSIDLHVMNYSFYIGNMLLAMVQNLLNGLHLNDPLTGLRVVRWDILNGWKPKSKGFDIEAELNHRVERQGYYTQEISISYRPRLGVKKLKLIDGLTILKRIIMESITRNLA